MHWTYGKIDGIDYGRFFDTVIPNYWNLDDFSEEVISLDQADEPYIAFV